MSLSSEDRKTIQEFLNTAEQGKLVQSIEALHDFLCSRHLAWRQQMTSEYVGVSEYNRDGIGLSASHVQELASNIASIGFSKAEVKAVCVEVPPGPKGDHTRAFNKQLVEGAAGKLAPVTGVRYASIVGSHASQAARAFLHKVQHPDPKLTIEGRLSLERLQTVDPDWANAITHGVTWLIVSHMIPEEFPKYASLAQAAGNAAGQIASKETEIQLAKKLNTAVAAFLAAGHKTVSYADVSAEILRSRPPNSSSLPSMFSFVVKCGGGAADHAFLHRTERFVRSHGAASRALGGDFWHALSADIKGPEQCVLFRHMLLKLALCGPEKAVSISDAKRAFTSKDLLPKICRAEGVWKEVRELLLLHVDADAAEKDLCDLEMQLAAIVLQKKKVATSESLEEACEKCLSKHGVDPPWRKTEAPTPAVPGSSSASPAGSCPGSVCTLLFVRDSARVNWRPQVTHIF